MHSVFLVKSGLTAAAASTKTGKKTEGQVQKVRSAGFEMEKRNKIPKSTKGGKNP
jgi:hypothetical protein